MSSQARPLILVDVDDVLNMAGFSSAARRHLAFYHGWRRGKAWSEGREYPLLVNPAHGRLLRDLAAATGAELAWATTMEETANLYIGPLLGLPPLAVAAPAPFREKAQHVVPWTGGRPWIWLDNDTRELAAASAVARETGQPHLCVPVNPAIGLTARDAAAARAWLAGQALGGPVPEELSQPCGREKCPWARSGGGLPQPRKTAAPARRDPRPAPGAPPRVALR